MTTVNERERTNAATQMVNANGQHHGQHGHHGHHHMLSVSAGNTLPSIHSLQASLEVGGQLLATKCSPSQPLMVQGQLQLQQVNGTLVVNGQQPLLPVTVKKAGRRGRPPKKDAKSRNRQGECFIFDFDFGFVIAKVTTRF